MVSGPFWPQPIKLEPTIRVINTSAVFEALDIALGIKSPSGMGQKRVL